MESYYEILGITKTSTEAEIKSAYKKLAKKYHPDVNKEVSAQQKFQKIAKAYQILSDPQKRAAYDRMGHATFEQAQKGGYGSNNPHAGAGFGQAGFSYEDIFGGSQDPFDIFEGLFGFRRYGDTKRSEQTGESIEVVINLSFEDAVKGCTKSITYNRLSGCEKCSGTGSAKPGEQPVNCTTCGGSGQVRTTQSFLGAQFAQVTACPTCRGAGKKIKNPCISCSGTGRSKKNNTVTVEIPAGVDTGSQIKYRNKGNVGEHNATSGDLYITCKVAPHSVFARKGSTIILHLPLTISQAVLGDSIEVPTIDGKERIDIPTGTQHHQEIVLKKKGVPNIQNGLRGDQVIITEIQIPKHITREQKTLFTELSKLERTSPSLIDKLFS